MRVSVLSFQCPACGVREGVANGAALARLCHGGLCQGCRAARSLERRPELLPLFVEFWRKSGFPASSSWLNAAVPGSGRTRAAPNYEAPAVAGMTH